MKFIKIFIILLLSFSCSNKKDIAEFENILGKENSEMLTYLVSDFENDFLKRQFPNMSTKKAYNKFLTELKNENTDFLQKISKESRKKFEESNLRLEIYSIPDSIWIERNPDSLTLQNGVPTLKIRRKYLKSDGTFHHSISESSYRFKEDINSDSIIETRKNWVDINWIGKYAKAMNSVSKKSRFMKDYLHIRDAAGTISPILVAHKMLDSDVDVSDYFIKRLIITEIVY